MKGLSAILGDDAAIELLLNAKRPKHQGSGSLRVSSQATTNKSGGRNTTKSTRPNRSADVVKPKGFQEIEEELVDEEVMRSRKYWEKWASHASKELLKTVYSDVDRERPEKELVFSGRCGSEPKYRTPQNDDTMSEVTDISLLSTSTLAYKDFKLTRKKKKTVSLAQAKPDWEKLAKERTNKGVLDRLIRKDTSHMERYMTGRSAPVRNFAQNTVASDLMEQHDKTLVKYTAYSRGLAGRGKSCSTENVLSVIQARDNKPQLPASQSSSNLELQVRFRQYDSRRTPSPQQVKNHMLKIDRPESAVEVIPNEFNVGEKARFLAPIGPQPRPHTSPYCPKNDLPEIPVSNQSQDKVNEHEAKGSFIRRVHRRMRATVNALDRATGFGDKTDSVNTVSGEKAYTARDYGRVARYPQNIRIAPQLGKVIKAEIRDKMGKPRRHAIRIPDIKQLDAENPKLGRSNRNMIIFNWLNEMDVMDYGEDTPPEIYDMEGKPSKGVKFTLYGDVSDAISDITTRASSEYTSLYSGRVSDDEDDGEDDSDGLSVATGSACLLSSDGGSVQHDLD